MNTDNHQGEEVPAVAALLAALGEDAPARKLTADKVARVMARDRSQVTGFVVTDKNGGVGIIDKSAVRWLSMAEMWDLMHDPVSGVEAGVCHDIAKRQKLGVQKYGATVATNPAQLREWMQHAYKENLDAAIYLKRAMLEISAPCGEHGGAMADCPRWQNGCCTCGNA